MDVDEAPAVTPETSGESAQAAAATSTPAPDQSASGEASSPHDADTGRDAKSSLLDAVLKVVPATNETDVLAETAAQEGDAPDPQTPEGQGQAEAPEADGEDVPDDEQAQEASPAIRKKINKLLKQRRELRQEAQRLNGEIENLRGAADVGGEIQEFARTTGLSAEDVAGTLQIAAALRSGDYASFYKMISPFVRTAQEYLGIVLPNDLAARVRAGHMTEQAARDFARQRFDGQRAEITAREATAVSQRQVLQTTQGNVQRAVANYEARLAASDPDYKAKAPSVRRVAQAMLLERGGKIASVDEALAITKEAYDEVSKTMRAMLPKPRPTSSMPNGSAQTPSARAAPKTLMEAAIQGLENSRRAQG